MAGNDMKMADVRSVVLDETFHFLVNGEPLSVRLGFSDGDVFDAVTLTVEQLNSFEWLDNDGTVSITVNDVPLQNGKCEFSLEKISKDDKITVQITENGVSRSFSINTLNSRLPLITPEGISQTPGDFFLSFINSRSIVKTDNEGNILYYRNEDSDESQYGLWDFKTHFINGKTYYSYHSTYNNPGEEIVFTGHNPGEHVLMDENYNEITRITAVATEKNRGDTALDGHEFLMLGEDHYIVMSYLQMEVDNIPDQNIFTGEPIEHAEKPLLVVAYIQEIDHGEVKFEWLSSEHPELYSMTATEEVEDAASFTNTDPNTYVDYVHLNAIAVEEDGNLLISCRHLNTMLKIDRVGGTGNLIWALSGVGDEFGLAEDQKTSGQHYLYYYGNGLITAFNNNNKEGLTNLVHYQLNEDETALADDGFRVWVVPGTTKVISNLPCPPHKTYACGAFQLIGDYGVVGWGWNLSGDELATEFSLNDASEISFQLRSIYDPDASCATYRVVKCLSSAPELAFTQHAASWSEINASSGYQLSIERQGTEGVLNIGFNCTALDIFNLPNGEYAATITENDFRVSSAEVSLTVEDNLSLSAFVSTENGVTDLFFAKSNGIWSSRYFAKHAGSVNDWEGTGEMVSLGGKNQLCDLFFGSADSSLLVLTDDDNGDALFIDDIYSSSPENLGATQARLGQIQEIVAGAGDDIVDMTSQDFDYVGFGMAIFGGDGDDVIWAGRGVNNLFGDAGNDRIVGASGDDIIVGGSGDDSMHGGGGTDVFTFGGNWGNDTIEQLASGKVVLWFKSGDESKWDEATLTYTDGANSVKVSGGTGVSLLFGDDNGNQVENYNALVSIGAFSDSSTDRIFEIKGMLA